MLRSLTLALAITLAGCGREPEPSSSDDTAGATALIIPWQSVGRVHAGMTSDQVRAELGPPERTTPNALEYSKVGFAVMPGPDGVIQVVMCGDVTGLNGPFVKRFKGRTKEGIGLGSTREELIKIYGEPSNDEKFAGSRESMKYDSLGITFSLETGQVHHMIVRLKPSSTNQPNATESVEIAP